MLVSGAPERRRAHAASAASAALAVSRALPRLTIGMKQYMKNILVQCEFIKNIYYRESVYALEKLEKL